MKSWKMIIAIMVLLISSTSVHSATLVIANGELMGADGITFDGYTASVRFLEGTCVDLFNGCDQPSDIVFQSLTSNQTQAKDLAIAANTALLTQVFDTNPLYDINVGFTYGCSEGTTALGYCTMITPYYYSNGYVVTSTLRNNDDNVQQDIVAWGQGILTTNSTIPLNPNATDRNVYASWSITPVPVPAAGLLFISGLFSLGIFGYRKKTCQA